MSDICKTTGHDCIKCNPGPCEHRAAEITKAEAIAHFKYGITHDIFSEPVISYAKLAIEALEKQIPFKPVIDRKWTRCKCGQLALHYNYCPNCGQKFLKAGGQE